MRARELAVGPVPCLALRVTYVGELGWELYCPTEFGLALWDAIWEAGREPRPRRRRLQGDRLAAAREGLPRLGLRHHARRHAVRGRARLRGEARQGRLRRARGAARRAGAGAPPLLPRARRPARRSRSAPSPCASTATLVGRVTSGGYGYTVERSIAYAYLPAERGEPGTQVEVGDLRRVGRGRGRGGAALRPGRRAHPRVIDEVARARVWPGGGRVDRAARRRDHEPQLQGDVGGETLRAADRRQRHRAARDRPLRSSTRPRSLPPRSGSGPRWSRSSSPRATS